MSGGHQKPLLKSFSLAAYLLDIADIFFDAFEVREGKLPGWRQYLYVYMTLFSNIQLTWICILGYDTKHTTVTLKQVQRFSLLVSTEAVFLQQNPIVGDAGTK